mmetsp:Transcript_126156/g.392752  ORF Transcript_126156/g.392752 Transcript_126156/m.392752 type:complete len:252 (+) Transcript_126156:420-1175(+)
MRSLISRLRSSNNDSSSPERLSLAAASSRSLATNLSRSAWRLLRPARMLPSSSCALSNSFRSASTQPSSSLAAARDLDVCSCKSAASSAWSLARERPARNSQTSCSRSSRSSHSWSSAFERSASSPWQRSATRCTSCAAERSCAPSSSQRISALPASSRSSSCGTNRRRSSSACLLPSASSLLAAASSVPRARARPCSSRTSWQAADVPSRSLAMVSACSWRTARRPSNSCSSSFLSNSRRRPRSLSSISL